MRVEVLYMNGKFERFDHVYSSSISNGLYRANRAGEDRIVIPLANVASLQEIAVPPFGTGIGSGRGIR